MRFLHFVAWFAALALLPALAAHGASPVVTRVVERGDLSGSFDISPNGAAVVGVRGNLVDAASGRSLLRRLLPGSPRLVVVHGELALEKTEVISGFAFTDDGTLVVVSGQKLGIVSGRRLALQVELPAPNMRIASGRPGQLLLFGGDGATPAQREALEAEITRREALFGRTHPEARRLRARLATLPNSCRLYAWYKGGRSQLLLETPSPVRAATVHGETIWLATSSAIFEWVPGGEMTIRLAAPEGRSIDGLAIDPADGVAYFTADRTLYALRGDRISQLAEAAGTELRFEHGALWVLDAKRGRLLRVALN